MLIDFEYRRSHTATTLRGRDPGGGRKQSDIQRNSFGDEKRCYRRIIRRYARSSPRKMSEKYPLSYISLGHYERKLKHLNKQKEGKKKMKRIGNIDLPQEAFFTVLSSKAGK